MLDHAAIGPLRLVSQGAAQPACADPAAVVRRLLAVQAQDYLGALWAVGLRTAGATEASVERAVAEARIVRTWPMRGTIHFLAAEDVRWMLDLLAPRVVRRTQGRLRQLGLDDATIATSADVVARALEGGRRLTRPALYAALEAAGISAAGQRGLHILGQLAHARQICFGPRDGKQPTFVLLDEWVPPSPAPSRDEALATLALRYFAGRGPATVEDLVWWSGLTLSEARAALAAVEPQLARAEVGGRTYYAAEPAAGARGGDGAFLLPPFDEFLIAYRDRSATLEPAHSNAVAPGANGIFNPIMVSAGRVVGTWRRALGRGRVAVSFHPFEPVAAGDAAAFAEAARRYADFLGARLELAPESTGG